MPNNTILAVIVTYNPDIQLLNNNITALYPQVEYICIYDNCSGNIKEIENLCSGYEKIHLFKNEKNEGLPINYNRALNHCLNLHCDWLLTMDQDTIVPDNLIQTYSTAFSMPEAAIISPVMVDINIETEDDVIKGLPQTEYTEIDYCISSASLNRVSILKSLGGFDEQLFIDQVDFDYCRNVTTHGYKVLRMNKCVILHQIGKGKVIRILGKRDVAFNHAPFRKYYFFRNRVYFARKYHITLFNEPVFYRNLFKHFLVLFHEKQTGEKLKQAAKGIRDGLKMKISQVQGDDHGKA